MQHLVTLGTPKSSGLSWFSPLKCQFRSIIGFHGWQTSTTTQVRLREHQRRIGKRDRQDAKPNMTHPSKCWHHQFTHVPLDKYLERLASIGIEQLVCNGKDTSLEYPKLTERCGDNSTATTGEAALVCHDPLDSLCLISRRLSRSKKRRRDCALAPRVSNRSELVCNGKFGALSVQTFKSRLRAILLLSVT